MKRSLAALVLSSGAALALTPAVAHAADEQPPVQGQPIVERAAEIVDHPAQTVQDAKTAVAITAAAAGSASKATDSSLAGAGTALAAGLPKSPKVG
ncbi:hypothetical protein [Streptomyces sp. NPDC091268]|uniref:hypothetical protein n=1 Tax=Streptomyces sp. NPDC091268 TaxID=3365979 RepID=UPI0038192F69